MATGATARYNFQDARRGQVKLAVKVDELEEWAKKGRKVAWRGTETRSEGGERMETPDIERTREQATGGVEGVAEETTGTVGGAVGGPLGAVVGAITSVMALGTLLGLVVGLLAGILVGRLTARRR